MTTSSPAEPPRFDYQGPDALQATITAALKRVVDPELALSIVEVGLVYGVQVSADRVWVRMTMTSPACPVTASIVDEVEGELDRVLPPAYAIEVELCWEPAWTRERMSEHARRFMGG